MTHGSVRRAGKMHDGDPGACPEPPSLEGDQRARTLSAWGPFGPWVISNSTREPSLRDLKPVPAIAVWWTKTSAPPPSCAMKPKPLSSLNHLTVPCAISLTFGKSGAGRPAQRHAEDIHTAPDVQRQPKTKIAEMSHDHRRARGNAEHFLQHGQPSSARVVGHHRRAGTVTHAAQAAGRLLVPRHVGRATERESDTHPGVGGRICAVMRLTCAGYGPQGGGWVVVAALFSRSPRSCPVLRLGGWVKGRGSARGATPQAPLWRPPREQIIGGLPSGTGEQRGTVNGSGLMTSWGVGLEM